VLRPALVLALLAACRPANPPRDPTPPAPSHEPAAAPHDDRTLAISGAVLGPDGKPAANALVAALDRRLRAPLLTTTAGADGRFSLLLPSTGDYAFTATHPDGAVHQPFAAITRATQLTLRLAPGDFTVSGTATVRGAATPRLAFAASDAAPDRTYVTTVATDGTYALRLPAAAATHSLLFTLDAEIVESIPLTAAADRTIDPILFTPGPPPDDIVAYVARAAHPLTTVDAGHGHKDLAPLTPIIKNARIIALGEATHGTAEFFKMKHRLLEYLVEQHGVRTFAIEANLPETRRVNDYILHGKGDPKAAIGAMYVWTWHTEEVLAMVEWMRRWNQVPKRRQKLRFHGFDAQFSHVAWPELLAYLERADPGLRTTIPPALDIFNKGNVRAAWPSLSAADRTAVRATIERILAHLDEQRATLILKTSEPAWRLAREDAAVCLAVARFAGAADETSAFDARDHGMADNVDWLLDPDNPEKIVLWAHNHHVARSLRSHATMGKLLAERHGPAYVNIGFGWSEGAFQVRDARQSGSPITAVTLPPPFHRDGSTVFVRAGCERCLLDLRDLPPGDIAAWFAGPHIVREPGAAFEAEHRITEVQQLSRQYDAYVFIRESTPTHPLTTPRAAPPTD